MRRARRPRILVLARGHVGDVISALPALRDLRAGYPDARISLVANEYVRGMLDGCPYMDEVIYGFGYRPRSAPETLAMRLKLVARTAARFDIFLALRDSPRSGALLGLLSGSRRRIGYHQSGAAGRLLTTDLGRQPAMQSNRLTNARVAAALGLQTSPTFPALDWVSADQVARAEDALASRGIGSSSRFAVLQVASHWGCYEWHSAKWATVAHHLTERYGLKVTVIGTGEDFERLKFAEIAAFAPHVSSLQGLTTLPMLFEVVSRASLVVAPDSALTQVAIAQRVPAIILFGIEPSIRNGPLAEENGAFIESVQHWEGAGLAPAPNQHCRFGESHCHTAHCRENSSFERITAEEVCRRVDLLMDSRGESTVKRAAAWV